jgi:hypothetical protein
MAKKWIQGAIKRPGALTRKAESAGQSPMAFAQAHKGDSGLTGQQSRLAVTLRGMHHAQGGMIKSGSYTTPQMCEGGKVLKSWGR